MESATANQVVESLHDETDWNPKTIKTLLNRLVKKQALGYREEGRIYHYHALFSEQECVQAAGRSFVKRVYGGALKPMLAGFLEDADLSPEDVAELQSILERRKES
jgi:BlaI family penicillinase repressor